MTDRDDLPPEVHNKDGQDDMGKILIKILNATPATKNTPEQQLKIDKEKELAAQPKPPDEVLGFINMACFPKKAPEQTAIDEAPPIDSFKSRNQKQLQKWI